METGLSGAKSVVEFSLTVVGNTPPSLFYSQIGCN